MIAMPNGRSLHPVADVAAMIAAGDVLLLAGEERLLRQLPTGRWVGGTIPYFMTAEAGGTFDQERVFVQRLPACATVHWQGLVGHDALGDLADDGPDNGFSVLLLPSQSEAHRAFALNGLNWAGLFRRPLVGWVSGIALDRIGIDTPKVFDGATGSCVADGAVVMHVALPAHAYARVDIVNLFVPGDGPVLTFGAGGDATGFTVEWVMVDGVRRRLVDYIADAGIDTRLPLVADYNGAMINVATAAVDAESGQVTFFAPVLPDTAYRFARPVEDYARDFAAQIAQRPGATAFSCNCILNYTYAELAGKHTGGITGPMSFGEIAYILLTQSFVHLTIEEDTAD